METFTLPSSRNGCNLFCYSWIPAGSVRGTVQILHGMLEYIPRYEVLAQFLNSNGFAVFGHDHLGHGRTSPTEPGFFNETDGDLNLVEDAKVVCDHICKTYTGVPHFIIGHSMGSYIARRFMTKYGSSVNGVVCVGTGNRSLEDAERMVGYANKFVAELGPRAYSEDLDGLVLGKNFSRVKVGASDTSQMTEERRNRLRFQTSGYRDMFMLTLRLAKEEDFGNIPASLPVAFFSGSEDQVGAKGQGVISAADILRKYGSTPYVNIYDGMNHDILHEEGCQKVFKDILDWISGKI
ncbi:MAG: alpha/beta hydrolase [archaeon]|nr:alpha/beta hydrolase [archaeon]